MKTLIITILLIPIVLGINALIYWGIGCFIINVFAIEYVWTFWHGLAFTLVVIILKSIFSGDSN